MDPGQAAIRYCHFPDLVTLYSLAVAEREMRRRLMAQSQEQTEGVLIEMQHWKNRATKYQRDLMAKEKELQEANAQLTRLGELAKKALQQMQGTISAKDREIRKKDEVLLLLKDRFRQMQASGQATRSVGTKTESIGKSLTPQPERRPAASQDLVNKSERPRSSSSTDESIISMLPPPPMSSLPPLPTPSDTQLPSTSASGSASSPRRRSDAVSARVPSTFAKPLAELCVVESFPSFCLSLSFSL